MKINHLAPILVVFLLFAANADAQVTSISQLVDVPPTADYYADLQSLIERYGVVGNDLIVAGQDSVPRSTVEVGSAFHPKARLTNRQFAFLLEASLDRMRELIGGQTLPNGLDAAAKYAMMKDLRSAINKKPLSKVVVTTTKGVKGFDLKFEEALALMSLIESHGLGADLLNLDGSYNRTRTYSEKEISDILSNALLIKPACVRTRCTVGNLALNFQNKAVDRARFARILNQYLDAFVEKLENIINHK